MTPPDDRSGARPQRERGSGTVLALAVVFVLLALMSAVLLLVQAAVGAERAATSADLAALAGADAARGIVSGQPCEVALAVVVRHQAALVSCTINGTDRDIVEIATSVELPGPWGTATGRARAGPPP